MIPGFGERMVRAHGGERILSPAQNTLFESMVYALTSNNTLAAALANPTFDRATPRGGANSVSVNITNDLSGLTVQGPITPDELEDLIDEKSAETANAVLSALGNERVGHSGRYATRRS